MVVRSKEKEKNVVLIRKRQIKGRKHIAPMDFAEYLRKSDVSENSREMRWKWMITAFLLDICPFFYHAPPLIRERPHLLRDTAEEKEVDIAI